MFQYNDVTRSIAAYSEAVIQFGYITLFITALPIACVGALLCVVVNIKVKAWALLNLFQRPLPEGAEDIGQWCVLDY